MENMVLPVANDVLGVAITMLGFNRARIQQFFKNL